MLLAVKGALLQRANRYDSALAPLQNLAATHPADPGLWLDLAEGYRLAHVHGGDGGTGEGDGAGGGAGQCDDGGWGDKYSARRSLYPVFARKSVQLACKMIRVCSNARQCRVTLSRHQRILLRIQVV